MNISRGIADIDVRTQLTRNHHIHLLSNSVQYVLKVISYQWMC